MMDITKLFIPKNEEKDEAVNFQRFVEEKPLQRPVEEILSNLIERPSPEEAISLSEEEIVKSARKLGYPLDSETMKKIYAVQESSLPLFESLVTWLLKREESKEPFYYAFARDGELLYDALWGIGHANENDLSKRVKYLKASTYLEENELNQNYFNQIGISNLTLENGNSLVFLDSGFVGSLFYKVQEWAKIKNNNFEKNVKGYLVSSVGDFDQLDFYNSHSDKIIKKFNEKMDDSPYSSNSKGHLPWDLCAFMQLMPKFTGRYVRVYQKENQNWDVLPEGNRLISKLRINPKNSSVNPNPDQINSIKRDKNWINADIVDPVASLLLQKRTLEYFANPNVQDRVYSRIKTNSKLNKSQFNKSFEKGYISFN